MHTLKYKHRHSSNIKYNHGHSSGASVIIIVTLSRLSKKKKSPTLSHCCENIHTNARLKKIEENNRHKILHGSAIGYLL